MWDVSSRWLEGRPFTRVDLWQRDYVLASDVPIREGSVTESWKTGVRSTLSLSVEPSPEWLAWLAEPDLEILPYAGFDYGLTQELVPLGVFPVLFPGVSAPLKAISLSGQDHWQYVVSAKFLFPTMSYPGLIRDVAAQLAAELGLGAPRLHPVTMEPAYVPLVTASSAAEMTPVLWDRSRSDVVAQLVESIGAEAFINRYGQPEVRDRVTQPGRDLSDGSGGAVISVDSAVDWSDVINSIAVTSSKSGVVFDPAIVEITDPTHPASNFNIGPRYDAWSSPLMEDRAQAMLAAQSILLRRSSAARSWSVQCMPDPARMPGDEFTLTTAAHGANRVAVQEVTHPLGEGTQTVKLGAV